MSLTVEKLINVLNLIPDKKLRVLVRGRDRIKLPIEDVSVIDERMDGEKIDEYVLIGECK